MKRTGWMAALVCAALVVGACDSASSASSTAEGPGRAATTACAKPAATGVKVAKHLVSCLAPSVVLIESVGIPMGSGLVIAHDDDKYVVTNLHVVDPEPTVEVVITGGERVQRLEEVPVVGVDKTADLAVLGPIETDRPPVALVEPSAEKGDDVYLIGYPGETEDEPEVTISGGIVSRLRDDDVFELGYVQTDATIAGGQSGGALADASGKVIGVSGSSFADDNFALALDGSDVLAAVERILDGNGDDYWTFPATDDDAGATSGTVRIRTEDETMTMYLETEEAATLEMSLTPAAESTLIVGDYDTGDNLFIDRRALDRSFELSGTAPAPDVVEEQIKAAGLQVGEPVGPGSYRVELPADTRITIDIGALAEGEREIGWTSNLPLLAQEDDEVDLALDLDEPHTGIMDGGEREASFTVDLEADQDYDVTVDSSASDPGIVILGPGESYVDAWSADDSDSGLFGTDVDEVFTPKSSGPHVVLVENYSGYAMAYRLRIAESE